MKAAVVSFFLTFLFPLGNFSASFVAGIHCTDAVLTKLKESGGDTPLRPPKRVGGGVAALPVGGLHLFYPNEQGLRQGTEELQERILMGPAFLLADAKQVGEV